MKDSLVNASERYKISTIDLSLPEINHQLNKKYFLKDKQGSTSPTPRNGANEVSFSEREFSAPRMRDENGQYTNRNSEHL